MTDPFAGKVALVTGAASGIGRATALAFAARGAKVVVSDIDSGGGEGTVRQIEEAGGDAVFVKADVSQAADVAAMIDTAIETYGRLDVAYNNAGIIGAMGMTADSTEANWDHVIDVNLKSVYLCMKAEIPHMLAVGGGAIVNCASIAGLVGYPMLPAYAASKHGVIGLTKTAALEYATSGIRINAVCPGAVDTPIAQHSGGSPAAMSDEMIRQIEPIGRIGQPEEIAAAVVWLCSPEASFVIGEAMAVDGGWVAR